MQYAQNERERRLTSFMMKVRKNNVLKKMQML